MSKDRRAKTSRANLGEHIPEALDPQGTIVVAVRLPQALAKALDEARGTRSRSQYLRDLVTTYAGEP